MGCLFHPGRQGFAAFSTSCIVGRYIGAVAYPIEEMKKKETILMRRKA
jgi:hypothetical protein